MGDIGKRCREILDYLSEAPQPVTLVAAAKGRSAQEVLEAVGAGVRVIGENTVQEAEAKVREIGKELKGRAVELHFIGKLQKNKINRALKIFDCIQSFHSLEMVGQVDKRAEGIVRGLIEVNIGRERSKIGFYPEMLERAVQEIGRFESIRIEGLMAVEPYSENPEDARPYFREMKQLFERMKQLKLPDNVEMGVLSMGMSSSWRVAVEEGCSMVRIGTRIFGPRG
jgi:hypothetical protein